MSGRHERNIANLTVTQKVGNRVSDRYWPMQVAAGKDRHGVMQTREVYVDMHSGAVGREKHIVETPHGWDSPPPNLPSGDQGRQAYTLPASPAYRRNYDAIDWEE